MAKMTPETMATTSHAVSPIDVYATARRVLHSSRALRQATWPQGSSSIIKVSSRSYQFRMALNTWHVWQYVIGIDITLSLAESTRHFFRWLAQNERLKELFDAPTVSYE